MTIDLVAVMFVAAGLVSIGVFAVAWRHDATAALAGIPLMLGGAGVALVGVTRFAARAPAAVQTPSTQVVVSVSGPPVGQEAAVLIAIVAVVLVALGVAFAGRAGRATRESSR